LFLFWLFNIAVVYWLGSAFGFSPSNYPFPITFSFKVPILSDLVDNIILTYLRHGIGFIIFLGLFRLLMGSEKFKIVGWRIVKLFSLSSFIFIPYCLVKIYCWRLLMNKYFDGLVTPFMQSMQHWFLTGELTLKDGEVILSKGFKVGIVVIAISMIFIIWWFWFMQSGLKFIKILNVRINKIFIKVCIWFVIIQVVFTSIFAINALFYGAKPYLIISFKQVEKAISENPPNYEKATKLCEAVVENKYSPDYFKYVGAVRNLEYGMATFSFLGPSRKFIDSLLRKTSSWGWRGDYRKIQLEMNNYFEKEFSMKKDAGHSLEDSFLQFKEKLIRIEELYNSKGFHYEAEKEAETMSFGVCCLPANAEDVNKENVLSINNQKKDGEKIKIKSLGVFINVCAWGKIFVIFPDFTRAHH
jgi:hypothetical protein